ncbi:MAG: tRNA 2-thiouridine(34) synthase MnmA [Bacillota bacterium]
MKPTVAVGMSGGVDSSVAAALLKEQGYNVIGITLQISPREIEDEDYGGCCSLSSINDARRVCDKLGIPFYVLNFRELFAEKVIDYFCQSYLRGETPNPCIACNKEIKFEAFLRKARALGADYIATGHYARREYDEQRGRWLLRKGVDQRKDQSYVLYTFTQEQLAHTLFPLGEMVKEQTRELARKLELPVANKPESQEICFVPDDDYGAFLEEKLGEQIKPGPFLDRQGRVLGQHKGIVHYTIGQRKGLGIALGKPMFVVDIDPERNAVILGEAEEVYSDRLVADELNLISLPVLNQPVEVEAKIRYAARPAPALVRPLGEKAGNGDRVQVEFKEPQRAITPGQAVVFYQGEYVLGGGVIRKLPLQICKP